MTDDPDWRDKVKIVRAADLAGSARATAVSFTGTGGCLTWLGRVVLAPGASTGAHHHGRHEVATYIAAGRAELRWGERLEFAASVGPGDFAYFAPFVPHQERNLDATEPVVFVVVRSDDERIRVDLPIVPAETPEIFQ
jgi:uncharacterized RmlC-like cupin family protein